MFYRKTSRIGDEGPCNDNFFAHSASKAEACNGTCIQFTSETGLTSAADWSSLALSWQRRSKNVLRAFRQGRSDSTVPQVLLYNASKGMAKSCRIFFKIRSLKTAVYTSANCASAGEDNGELTALQNVNNRPS